MLALHGRDGHRGLRRGGRLHRLAVLEGVARVAQHLVAGGEAARERRSRRCADRARRARAAPSAACRPSPARRRPCRRRARWRSRAASGLAAAASPRRPSAYRPGELRLLLARRNPPAPRPGAWWRWRRGSRARIVPVNSCVPVAVHAEAAPPARPAPHRCCRRRPRPSKRRLVGIDDLQQLLADLRGVAGRDLAVADDAVEGRAHLGALHAAGAASDRARPGGLACRSARCCGGSRRLRAAGSRPCRRSRSFFMRSYWRWACS